MRLFLPICILLLAGCYSRPSAEEQQQLEIRKVKTQNAVSNWIKKYSLYPESYQSISFSDYSEAVTMDDTGKVIGTEIHEIKHTHKMLDKDSNMATFTGYFILESDYSVNVIELERSHSLGGASPPVTQIWTNIFGRPLNAEDSLELSQKQSVAKDQLIKELKDGIESGNYTAENPEDIEELKNVLNTLSK